ncbi:hypothetical protein M0802_011522 [Mischocyttarus mexicanus]|nr:hypothetical protein M0802_011522 [Mischocyttarus mexicanus]
MHFSQGGSLLDLYDDKLEEKCMSRSMKPELVYAEIFHVLPPCTSCSPVTNLNFWDKFSLKYRVKCQVSSGARPAAPLHAGNTSLHIMFSCYKSKFFGTNFHSMQEPTTMKDHHADDHGVNHGVDHDDDDDEKEEEYEEDCALARMRLT